MEFKCTDLKVDIFSNIAGARVIITHMPTGIKRVRKWKRRDGRVYHRERDEMIEEIKKELAGC